MAHSFEHIPVLRDEVVSLFASVPPGTVVDATVGGGGHAAAVLEAYPALRVVGLDRDPAALEAARARLSAFGDRVSLVRAPFSSLPEILSAPSFGPLSGVLFDLGVSSPQLDRVERGFSFRVDGPLDMRMDPTTGLTAADLVNSLPEESLAALFRENGEGRLSGRIARAVVGSRPLTSTRQLAEVVSSSVPAAVRRKGHPARRVFQALRIEVNDELGQLRAALPVALSHLAVGGVCAVISYHSGEDRLTKQTFAGRGLRRLRVSPGPALRVRCRPPSRAGLPRCAEAVTVRGCFEPARRECSTPCHRPDRGGRGRRGGEDGGRRARGQGQGQGQGLMAPPSAATAAPDRRIARRAAAPTPRRAPLRVIPGRSGSRTRRWRAPLRQDGC